MQERNAGKVGKEERLWPKAGAISHNNDWNNDCFTVWISIRPWQQENIHMTPHKSPYLLGFMWETTFWKKRFHGECSMVKSASHPGTHEDTWTFWRHAAAFLGMCMLAESCWEDGCTYAGFIFFKCMFSASGKNEGKCLRKRRCLKIIHIQLHVPADRGWVRAKPRGGNITSQQVISPPRTHWPIRSK